MDLENAFELYDKHVILESLARKGVRGQILKWTRDFLSDRRARTTYHGFLSSQMQFEKGTPQGSSLSPLLFNLAMERLLEFPANSNVHLIAFADDLTIVITGVNSVEEANTVLDYISSNCRKIWSRRF